MTIDNRSRSALSANPHGSGAASEKAPMPCGGIRWHCFHAAPNLEIHADIALRRLGFEVYLPLQCKRISRDEQRIVPIFPRYLFARFDARAVSWGRDALQRVSDRELGRFILSPSTRLPAAIPDGVVNALLAQCEANRVIYPPAPREMRRKDAGRVTEGPCRDFVGICSRTSRDRVWLLLNMLGRETEIEFRRDAVEIVEEVA